MDWGLESSLKRKASTDLCSASSACDDGKAKRMRLGDEQVRPAMAAAPGSVLAQLKCEDNMCVRLRKS